MTAQVETTRSLRIDAEEKEKTDDYKLPKGSIVPEVKNPLKFYNLRDSLGFNRMHKPFSMVNDNNGLLRPQAKVNTPKWFKAAKDESSDNEYDDNLTWSFKNDSESLELIYRDFGQVDGDIVQVIINEKVVLETAYLGSSYKGIKVDLIKGFNKINILALNQGDVGANTAAFQLSDNTGMVLAQNYWRLRTGATVSFVIYKE